ncbi:MULTISPECIES: YdcF family protein [unclassified Nocardia]|uniref:YdcF family protein n=1 Tax=unclassified Nocardia TaxID=2637762 RepID=UPI0024A8B8D1|nr:MULTISPECIES: YdcF family protein [unclassified Nocardia]
MRVSHTTAIIILGYGLRPDGSMRPALVERLRAGYVAAIVSPVAPVIVTGGNPRSGTTEARAMADWLIARGIARDRVHLESGARSTWENAKLAALVMGGLGCHDALLVTSADHLPRAQSYFADNGVSVVGTYTPEQTPPLLRFGPL